MTEFKYKFGLHKDKKDNRDIKLHVPLNITLPVKHEIIPRAIFDQQNIGSCSANAITNQIMGLYGYDKDVIIPSRLYQYYNSRAIEGNQDSDSGASFRDAYKALYTNGWCNEELWQYDTSKVYDKPPDECYTSADKSIKRYQSLYPSAYAIMYAISQNKIVTFGTLIHENFNDLDENFVVPLPKGQVLGGHAMCLNFYDAEKKLFGVVNSWSSKWGKNGMCYMTFEHVTNPDWSFDHWTIDK